MPAIIYPGESKRWLVAFNPEISTTSQGRTVEQALANLKAARALERMGFERRRQKGIHLAMRRESAVCVVPMHPELD